MNQVSPERVAEMLAGLEGVTPGPWRYYIPDPGYTDDYVVTDHPDHAPDEKSRFRHLVATTEGASLGQQATGQHIARMDPDTIRSILTELQALRDRKVEVTNEMVERLARYQTRRYRPWFPDEGDNPSIVDTWVEENWRASVDEARTALTAVLQGKSE